MRVIEYAVRWSDGDLKTSPDQERAVRGAARWNASSLALSKGIAAEAVMRSVVFETSEWVPVTEEAEPATHKTEKRNAEWMND